MDYRQLGRSGLTVSKLCLGTMTGFTGDRMRTAERIVDAAIDAGINFVDSADCYGASEETLGRILSKEGRRDKVVLATKGGWYTGRGPNDCGASRRHLVTACESSLRKLKTDCIDLYYIHVVDPNTPMEETLRALDDLVRQGKVRYIGTSKHPVLLIMEALAISERCGLERFVCEQPPYSILDRSAENDLIPMGLRHGVGLVPYYPLARGLLSGKYEIGKKAPPGSRYRNQFPGTNPLFTEEAIRASNRVKVLAAARGVSAAEFSLAWLMRQPGVTSACVGMRTVRYLRSGVRAAEIELTREELDQVDAIVAPGEYVSNLYRLNFYAPLRMNYAKAACKIPGIGAFLPRVGSE